MKKEASPNLQYNDYVFPHLLENVETRLLFASS